MNVAQQWVIVWVTPKVIVSATTPRGPGEASPNAQSLASIGLEMRKEEHSVDLPYRQPCLVVRMAYKHGHVEVTPRESFERDVAFPYFTYQWN